jgi:hypothetical protein
MQWTRNETNAKAEMQCHAAFRFLCPKRNEREGGKAARTREPRVQPRVQLDPLALGDAVEGDPRVVEQLRRQEGRRRQLEPARVDPLEI